MSLEATFSRVSPKVRAHLEGALEHQTLSVEAAVDLLDARCPDLHALVSAADELRQAQVGDTVTYVVNRNINFTNVCVKSCKFCAFSRTNRSVEGYYLPTEEVVRRARQAWELGATEVCVQAGLPPGMDGRYYIELCGALKQALPDLHLHGFSPEEVKYGCERSGLSVQQYLAELKAAGVGSLPGTSAEILDPDVRQRLAGGRISVEEWCEVIRAAHELEIPTTSTVMFGHVETKEELARHLQLLADLQGQTGGFTEFVPLAFVHEESPMYQSGLLPDCRPGPTGNEVVRLIAVARLMLGASFRNIQTSWVKEGLRQAQWLLSCGANDLGGTLMNESISTSAGASHGQRTLPRDLRRLIRDAGRTPVERNTRYEPLRQFGPSAADDPVEPLDELKDPEAFFGSYSALVADPRYRFEPVERGQLLRRSLPAAE